jgi:hypothetical protein
MSIQNEEREDPPPRRRKPFDYRSAFIGLVITTFLMACSVPWAYKLVEYLIYEN